VEQCPEPPAFLGACAAEEWRRVAPELHRLNLLTILDVVPLSIYCDAFATWRSASEALARAAADDEVTHGLTVQSADGMARVNPLVRIVSQVAADALRIAREFAMTPASRARVAGLGGAPAGGSELSDLLA
jgi:P27 family predicted phage terminase small subunit